MIIENWTGHNIDIVVRGRKRLTLYPVGTIRVPIKEKVVGSVVLFGEKIPIKALKRGNTNLPAPREGVYLLVSQITRLENPDRADLISPADLVIRNGATVACRAFAINVVSSS
jgi:hypothetical protein